ncbi:MAG: hypothetical protein ABI199_04755 [Bacteroidia bacterium]
MKIKIVRKIIFFSAFICTLPCLSFAQCKSFVKKHCEYKIAPFISNGQMNTTTMTSGQIADMPMTFYAGQSYRIVVCAQEVLGTIQFKLLDKAQHVIFDSTQNNDPDFWDFNVNTTQEFTIEVTVPPSDAADGLMQSGCVSILVGFKAQGKP